LSEAEAQILGAIRRRLGERQSPLIVALDGRSGVGKSTLASHLAGDVGGVVIAGDDFFAGGTNEAWRGRTPEERAGLVIDWRRLRTEVLEPLRAGRSAAYRPFDWKSWAGLSPEWVQVPLAPVVLLDGVYSGRPELADLIDLAVLIEMSDDQARRRRLVLREGAEYMASWHAIWDAAEDYYFTHVRTPEFFDLQVISA
jgi:uridine kinase